MERIKAFNSFSYHLAKLSKGSLIDRLWHLSECCLAEKALEKSAVDKKYWQEQSEKARQLRTLAINAEQEARRSACEAFQKVMNQRFAEVPEELRQEFDLRQYPNSGEWDATTKY